jgi:hypothetical protein
MDPSLGAPLKGGFDRRARLWSLGGLVAATLVVVALLPKIPQDPAYHRFADMRPCCGVPNAADVWSNAPFVVVGIAGLLSVRKRGRATFVDPRERGTWRVVFVGVLLTGFGSAYYHLEPNDETLVWDRLPMTIVFSAVVAAQLGERLGAGVLRVATPLLVALFAATVVYWAATEARGAGDLRFYGVAQFGPMLYVPALWALFSPRYDRTFDYGIVAGFYLLAKITEALDRPIFEALNGVVAGHALKHLAAAAAAAWFVVHVRRRRPIAPSSDVNTVAATPRA